MKAEECLIDNTPFSFFQIHVLYCNLEQSTRLLVLKLLDCNSASIVPAHCIPI